MVSLSSISLSVVTSSLGLHTSTRVDRGQKAVRVIRNRIGRRRVAISTLSPFIAILVTASRNMYDSLKNSRFIVPKQTPSFLPGSFLVP